MTAAPSTWPWTVKSGLVLLIGTYLYDAGSRLYYGLGGSVGFFQSDLFLTNLITIATPLIAIVAIALRRKWGRLLYLLPLAYLAYQTFVFVPGLTMRSPFADLEPLVILGLMILGIVLLFVQPSPLWFNSREQRGVV